MASSISPEAASHTSNAQLQRRFKRIASIADTSISYGIRARPDLVNKVQDNLAETLKSTSKSGTGVQGSGATAFVALMAYAHYNKVAIALNAPAILLPHGETGNVMVSQVPLKNGNAWWQGSAEGTTIFAMPNPDGAVFPVLHSTVVFNQVNFRAFTRDRAFVDTDNESNVAVMNATVTGATQKIDSIVWMNVQFMSSRIIYHGGPLFLSGVTFDNCQFDFGPDSTSQKLLSQIKEAGAGPVTVAYW